MPMYAKDWIINVIEVILCSLEHRMGEKVILNNIWASSLVSKVQ